MVVEEPEVEDQSQNFNGEQHEVPPNTERKSNAARMQSSASAVQCMWKQETAPQNGPTKGGSASPDLKPQIETLHPSRVAHP